MNIELRKRRGHTMRVTGSDLDLRPVVTVEQLLDNQLVLLATVRSLRHVQFALRDVINRLAIAQPRDTSRCAHKHAPETGR